jgi:sugar phosphate isomerase/epimerase
MSDKVMPIGVFTSAGAGLGLGPVLEKVLGLGVSTAQVHAPGPNGLNEENATRVAEKFSEAGVDITLVFCGFPGESYASIAVVKETVGLVPTATRDERAAHVRQIADWASWVGAPGIGIHIGFVTEAWDSLEFREIVDLIGDLADYCGELGLTMNLETGQESAETLLRLLRDVGRENLKVNFDPANMILYGSGEPLEALEKVSDYVASVHCKDAVWSEEPGEAWGEEVLLGEGDVDIRRFVEMLHEMGYTGPLTIEREVSGEQQVADIRKGVEVLKAIKREIGIG